MGQPFQILELTRAPKEEALLQALIMQLFNPFRTPSIYTSSIPQCTVRSNGTRTSAKGRASAIVVARAIITKYIVDPSIACLQRNASISGNASDPIKYPMHHISSSPYSKYTVAHGESVFNHRMMLHDLQSLNGINSSLSQHSWRASSKHMQQHNLNSWSNQE